MYELTGSHFFVTFFSNGTSSCPTLGYRRKYQELSRKLSDTSVSRRPVFPHFGHSTRYHSSWRASGDTPESSGLKSSMNGSRTGRSLSRTGTVPPDSQ